MKKAEKNIKKEREENTRRKTIQCRSDLKRRKCKGREGESNKRKTEEWKCKRNREGKEGGDQKVLKVRRKDAGEDVRTIVSKRNKKV